MFDATPLTLEEIVDQCRALSLAVIEVSHPMAKEALAFIQAEKIDLLYRVLNIEIATEPDDTYQH
ncbi:hypothetical protein [Rouxiella silvae]|uniref:hypothetical protein n=1 Tax=Rouxiella silvae TaxID=1646373 RepID=UPI001E418633|nr:hypothetical protein [Rouxiella silvae]